eukprot:GHVU01104614.1.p2 GENE.GHVU01104614.1~~GHVU01104614.1.p2  ORF type:complete len:347 (+),score=97.83 GHVU01104614.1:56-1096(+)
MGTLKTPGRTPGWRDYSTGRYGRQPRDSHRRPYMKHMKRRKKLRRDCCKPFRWMHWRRCTAVQRQSISTSRSSPKNRMSHTEERRGEEDPRQEVEAEAEATGATVATGNTTLITEKTREHTEAEEMGNADIGEDSQIIGDMPEAIRAEEDTQEVEDMEMKKGTTEEEDTMEADIEEDADTIITGEGISKEDKDPKEKEDIRRKNIRISENIKVDSTRTKEADNSERKVNMMMEVDPEEEEATTVEEEATEEIPQAVGIEEEATEDPGVKEEEITTAAAAAAEENGEAEEEINRRIRRIPHRRVQENMKSLCGGEDRQTVGRKNEHNESGKKLHHKDPTFTWTCWEI